MEYRKEEGVGRGGGGRSELNQLDELWTESNLIPM